MSNKFFIQVFLKYRTKL